MSGYKRTRDERSGVTNFDRNVRRREEEAILLEIRMAVMTAENEKDYLDDVIRCRACLDTNWWCRGCADNDKKTALIKSGLGQKEANKIFKTQFGSCSRTLIPCYICNRNGENRVHGDKTVTLNSEYWNSQQQQ
jgi:hypothetical protein